MSFTFFAEFSLPHLLWPPFECLSAVAIKALTSNS
jgi:hypothetical protein